MRVGPAVAIVCCAAGALAACSGSSSAPSSSPPKSAHAHSTFADCEEFREYYARALARELLVGGCWGCLGGGVIGGGAGGDPSGGAVPEPLTVSQTNTQEAGVDEDDLIKVDPDTGRFYVLNRAGGEFLTVNAVPAESMSVVSRQDLGGAAEGVYLDAAADRLVVVSRNYDETFWQGGGVSTQLAFYDVSDPDHPQVADRYEIEGYLLGSRRIGHRLHLVTASWRGMLDFSPEFWELLARYHSVRIENDWRRVSRLAEEIRARVAQAVREAPIEALLPTWRQGLDPGAATTPLACTAVTAPQLDERPGLVTITSIDTDGGRLAHVAAVNNTWHIYASAGHLYLMQGSGGWWWDESQAQQTAIYRFRIGDDGPAQAAGYGVVDGWIYDRYALSEHEGYVRLATTDTDRRGRQTTSLFVLGQSRGEPLEVVGAVRNFMVDESIRAARFMGDRGFVITFRTVDPLITFDLGDPHAPRLAGMLEVPGVVTYLHPYGADQLIGVGRYSAEHQLQVQQFDVSELSAPRVLARMVIGEWVGGAWSSAEYEPRAFTLFGNLLSLPVNMYETFSGFMVYRMVPTGGFDGIGRIDHGESGDRFNPPLRSVVLEEASGRTVLYTLSNDLLKADAVGDTLTPIQALPLAE